MYHLIRLLISKKIRQEKLHLVNLDVANMKVLSKYYRNMRRRMYHALDYIIPMLENLVVSIANVDLKRNN